MKNRHESPIKSPWNQHCWWSPGGTFDAMDDFEKELQEITQSVGPTWLNMASVWRTGHFWIIWLQGFSSLAHPQIDPNHPVCFSCFFPPQFEVLPKKTWKARRCHGSAKNGMGCQNWPGRISKQNPSIYHSPINIFPSRAVQFSKKIIYCKLWSQTLSIPEECVFHTWGPQPHEQTSQQPEHRCDTPTKWADDIPTCLDHDRSRDTHGCNLMDRLQCCWSYPYFCWLIIQSQVFIVEF